jgi:DNA-binding transcriptional LysR family regulator
MPSFDGWSLRNNGLDRRVEISVPNFLSVPFLLPGTQRIATIHRRLARRVVNRRPLKSAELPMEMPNVTISAIWHKSTANDPGINWVISKLEEVGHKKTNPVLKTG